MLKAIQSNCVGDITVLKHNAQIARGQQKHYTCILLYTGWADVLMHKRAHTWLRAEK